MTTCSSSARARLTTAITSLLLTLGLFTAAAQGQTSGDYRSAATGNWNGNSTWETFNGTTWVATSTSPTSADGAITIRSPHVVTVTANVTADQVTVDLGGQITINSGKTLTIANGAGTDLSVNGTLRSSQNITINSGAVIAFNSGGKYQHDFTNGGTIPTATWDVNSTCEIIGYTGGTSAPGGIGQTFGNFTWNCPNQTAAVGLAGALTTVNGNFTVTTTNTGSFRLASTQSPTLAIAGNYSQAGGTMALSSGNNSLTVINLSGNFSMTGGTLSTSEGNSSPGTVNVSGNFSQTAGTITSNGNTSAAIIF